VEDVEQAAKWPREYQLAVATDGAIDSNAVRALKNPICNIFPVGGPEEAESDAMEHFVYAHMAGNGRCVVSREDGASEQSGDNNEHKEFLVVLNALKDDEAVIDNGDVILTDVITVGRVDISKREGFGVLEGRKVRENDGNVRVGSICCGPVRRGRDRGLARGSGCVGVSSGDRRGRGGEEGAGNKLGWRVEGIKEDEEMDVNEVGNKHGGKIEWATAGEHVS
jgi:hypothetical protein